MSKKKIIAGLVLGLVFFVVYYDQQFEPKDIEGLRVVANSQTGVLPPRAFTTDGCSIWVNSFFGTDITDLCIEHDMKYWKGGSAQDREKADSVLRESVNERIPFMGDIMYLGIRVFAHPIVPAPWRWGYGFDYPYKY